MTSTILEDVDICVTCISEHPPQLPLRQELPSLGVEVVYHSRGRGLKASQREARDKVLQYRIEEATQDKMQRNILGIRYCGPISRGVHDVNNINNRKSSTPIDNDNNNNNNNNCDTRSANSLFGPNRQYIWAKLAERKRIEKMLKTPHALTYESYAALEDSQRRFVHSHDELYHDDDDNGNHQEVKSTTTPMDSSPMQYSEYHQQHEHEDQPQPQQSESSLGKSLNEEAKQENDAERNLEVPSVERRESPPTEQHDRYAESKQQHEEEYDEEADQEILRINSSTAATTGSPNYLPEPHVASTTCTASTPSATTTAKTTTTVPAWIPLQMTAVEPLARDSYHGQQQEDPQQPLLFPPSDCTTKPTLSHDGPNQTKNNDNSSDQMRFYPSLYPMASEVLRKAFFTRKTEQSPQQGRTSGRGCDGDDGAGDDNDSGVADAEDVMDELHAAASNFMSFGSWCNSAPQHHQVPDVGCSTTLMTNPYLHFSSSASLPLVVRTEEEDHVASSESPFSCPLPATYQPHSGHEYGVNTENSCHWNSSGGNLTGADLKIGNAKALDGVPPPPPPPLPRHRSKKRHSHVAPTCIRAGVTNASHTVDPGGGSAVDSIPSNHLSRKNKPQMQEPPSMQSLAPAPLAVANKDPSQSQQDQCRLEQQLIKQQETQLEQQEQHLFEHEITYHEHFKQQPFEQQNAEQAQFGKLTIEQFRADLELDSQHEENPELLPQNTDQELFEPQPFEQQNAEQAQFGKLTVKQFRAELELDSQRIENQELLPQNKSAGLDTISEPTPASLTAPHQTMLGQRPCQYGVESDSIDLKPRLSPKEQYQRAVSRDRAEGSREEARSWKKNLTSLPAFPRGTRIHDKSSDKFTGTWQRSIAGDGNEATMETPAQENSLPNKGLRNPCSSRNNCFKVATPTSSSSSFAVPWESRHSGPPPNQNMVANSKMEAEAVENKHLIHRDKENEPMRAIATRQPQQHTPTPYSSTPSSEMERSSPVQLLNFTVTPTAPSSDAINIHATNIHATNSIRPRRLALQDLLARDRTSQASPTTPTPVPSPPPISSSSWRHHQLHQQTQTPQLKPKQSPLGLSHNSFSPTPPGAPHHTSLQPPSGIPMTQSTPLSASAAASTSTTTPLVSRIMIRNAFVVRRDVTEKEKTAPPLSACVISHKQHEAIEQQPRASPRTIRLSIPTLLPEEEPRRETRRIAKHPSSNVAAAVQTRNSLASSLPKNNGGWKTDAVQPTTSFNQQTSYNEPETTSASVINSSPRSTHSSQSAGLREKAVFPSNRFDHRSRGGRETMSTRSFRESGNIPSSCANKKDLQVHGRDYLAMEEQQLTATAIAKDELAKTPTTNLTPTTTPTTVPNRLPGRVARMVELYSSKGQ